MSDLAEKVLKDCSSATKKKKSNFMNLFFMVEVEWVDVEGNNSLTPHESLRVGVLLLLLLLLLRSMVSNFLSFRDLVS